MHNIAVFGGTFDPIHLGHLKIAQAIQAQCHFSSFLFLPCRTPVHKGVCASAQQRVAMLELALEAMPIENATICLEEINRSTPSYMVETLKTLRKEAEPLSISLIIGWDAFLCLPSWYQYEQLLSLCHLLVVNRPHTEAPLASGIQSLLQMYLTKDLEKLKTQAYGCLYLFDAGTYPISSSALRMRIQHEDKVIKEIPESVCNFIKTNRLYETGH